MKQYDFELKYALHNASTQIDDQKAELIEPCMQKLFPLLNVEVEVNRPDLEEIFGTIFEMDLEDTMWRLFTSVSSKGTTVQQL